MDLQVHRIPATGKLRVAAVGAKRAKSADKPKMTADVYDNTGAAYNVTKVVDASGTLDPVAYSQYSPPFLSATFAFVYGLSFASITSVIVHVYLWHGKDIWMALRGERKLDIHGRLMLAYRKTPRWWYAVLIVVFTALSIVMVEVFHTELPVYGVFLALLIPAIYMIPCGLIQGITNVDANQLNVLSEFIGGYMFAGVRRHDLRSICLASPD